MSENTTPVESHGDGRRQIHQGATVVLTGQFFQTLGKLKMASESQSDLRRKKLTSYELLMTKEVSASHPLQELLMTKEASVSRPLQELLMTKEASGCTAVG